MSEQRIQTIKVVWKGDDAKGKAIEFTRSIKGSSESVKKLNEVMGETAEITQKVTLSEKERRAEAKRNVTAADQMIKRYDGLVDSYKMQLSLVGKNKVEQARLTAIHKLGANATKAQREEVGRLAAQLARQSTATNQAIGSMRNFRGIAQNVGWQLQDTIVQLQMGTSAMVVLSQQGSQFASAFGPTGAIVGAVIALSGAIGGALLPSLFDATGSTEELEAATAALNKTVNASITEQTTYADRLLEVEKISSRMAAAAKDRAIFEANKQIALASKSVVSAASEEMEAIGALMGRWKNYNDITSDTEAYEDARQRIIEGIGAEAGLVEDLLDAYNSLTTDRSQEAIVAFGDALSAVTEGSNGQAPEFLYAISTAVEEGAISATEAAEALKLLTGEIGDVGEISDKVDTTVRDLVAALKEEADTFGYTARQMSLYEAAAAGANWVDLERINTLYDTIEAQKASAKAAEEAAKKEKERINSIKSAFKSEQARLVKSTETVEGEYNRRKSIVDDYVSVVGATNAKAAQVYVDLEEWRTQQYLASTEKRMEAERKESLATVLERQRALARIEQTVRAGEPEWVQEERKHNDVLAELTRQRQALREDDFESKKQLDDLLAEETRRHSEAQQNVMLSNLTSVQMMGQSLADTMTNGVEEVRTATEEMNVAQKTMFFFNRSIAAATALINGIQMGSELAKNAALLDWTGMTSASMLTFGTSMGAANAAAIMGTTFAGMFDKGGVIPEGQMGIVAEYGTELVNGVAVMGQQGGTRVTSREKTAEMMSGGTGDVSIQVVNKIPGGQYSAMRTDDDKIKIIATQVFNDNIDRGVASVIDKKGTRTDKSLRRNYTGTKRNYSNGS